MNIKAELSEYVHRVTKEFPNIHFDTCHTGHDNVYQVTLWIWNGVWKSGPMPSEEEGKTKVMRMALNDLKSLKTELGVRVLLRMGLICRNYHLEQIRCEMKKLKKYFKQHNKPEYIPVMAKMYPIIDKLEIEMQKQPFCKTPRRGGEEHRKLMGISKENWDINVIPPLEAARKADAVAEQYMGKAEIIDCGTADMTNVPNTPVIVDMGDAVPLPTSSTEEEASTESQ